jgi:hypothetical protein
VRQSVSARACVRVCGVVWCVVCVSACGGGGGLSLLICMVLSTYVRVRGCARSEATSRGDALGR